MGRTDGGDIGFSIAAVDSGMESVESDSKNRKSRSRSKKKKKKSKSKYLAHKRWPTGDADDTFFDAIDRVGGVRVG